MDYFVRFHEVYWAWMLLRFYQHKPALFMQHSLKLKLKQFCLYEQSLPVSVVIFFASCGKNCVLSVLLLVLGKSQPTTEVGTDVSRVKIIYEKTATFQVSLTQVLICILQRLQHFLIGKGKYWVCTEPTKILYKSFLQPS